MSAPVKGRFGTVLLQVGKIEPGEEKTYEQVAAQIKREMAESRAKSEVGNLRDKIEDERAAGSTLAETAKKLGLKSVPSKRLTGRAAALTESPSPDCRRPRTSSAPHSPADVGVDTDPLQLPGGGYLYYDVTGVTPSRERPLEEVKDQVTARWRDDEIAKRLQAKADDLVGKLKTGTSFTQAASEAGLKVETAKDLQRGKSGGFIPAKTIEAVFRTPKGTPASAEGGKETERFVFRVTDVADRLSKPVHRKARQSPTTLQNSYTDDLVSEYIARLENDFGVTVNPSALNQVIGGGSQQ